MRLHLSALLAITITSFLIGCSGLKDMPTKPPESALEPISDVQRSGSSRLLWGLWKLRLDHGNQTITPEPCRNTEVHFDITAILNPPVCDDCLSLEVLQLKLAKGYAKVKVTIINKTKIVGCDVRGILVSNADGLRLTNADSYTDLWDDGGGITVNPFKAFATDQPFRKIMPGTGHVRIYEIEFESIANLVNALLVFDASWPGNCKEPYEIRDFVQEDPVYSDGGATDVRLGVYDWQYNSEDVFIDASPIGGGLVELAYDQGFAWTGTIATSQFNSPGVHRLLAYASSSGTALNLYNYIDLKIDACGPEGNEIWEDATLLLIGDDTNQQVVCLEDKADWYKINIQTLFTGELRLSLQNDTGVCDLTFFDNPGGPHLQWVEAQFGNDAVIDVTPFNLEGGTYYVRVRHIGSDIEARFYTLYNDTLDSLCYPDGNDSYENAIEIPNGYSSGIQYVCQEDKQDWFKYTALEPPAGKLKLKVLNGTGAADITLYDESQAPNPSEGHLAWKQADPITHIDFDVLGLPPGIYYMRVRHIGSDADYRAYLLSNDREPGWARAWGTGIDEKENGVALDSDGNIYTTGYFRGDVDLDPGLGVDMHSSGDKTGAYLSKFNTKGEYQWGITWGGFTGGAAAHDLAIDLSGNVYVTGLIYGTADLDPGGGEDEHTSTGISDPFLIKVNPNGDYEWGCHWGGDDDYVVEASNAIAVDGLGNVYVGGDYRGEVDFDPGPGYDIHISTFTDGGQSTFDAFLTGFNPDGAFRWALTWGGKAKGAGADEMKDRVYDVVVDPYDDIYVIGSFNHIVDFDPGPSTVEYNSVNEDQTYMSKFDSTGNFQWVNVWGATDYEDYGRGLAIDPAGYVYAVGFFEGVVNLDPGIGVDEFASSGGRDIFLSKFDLDGNYIWGRTWGGDDREDIYHGIDISVSGDIFIAGSFKSEYIDLDPGPDVDEHYSGFGTYLFLVRLDSDGNYKWGRSWGADPLYASYNAINDIAGWGKGVSYVSGFFQHTVDFDPGPGVDERITDGSTDNFLCRYAGDGYL